MGAAAEGEAGATAGPASPQEEADIGVEDAAQFSVMGLYPDGAIRGVTFWMPVDRVAAGAELSIGADDGVGGVVWSVPPGGVETDGFIPITGGGIRLTEAGTEPGAAIAATIYADFGEGQMPGDGSPTGGAVSGSLEVSFETAWGSNKGANPFGEGSVTNIASDDGVQSPEGLGVIAGVAGPDEQLLLPDVQDLASIAILASRTTDPYKD